MSSGRETDISQWLHNKLGSTDDLWSGSSICSQMCLERLQSVIECFHNLQSHVKVKFLLSIAHLPKRSLDQWKGELDMVLLSAQEDGDPWVGMIGDILKTYPSSGGLRADVDEGLAFFHDVISELKKIVKKNHDMGMLPMECPYLCRNAISSIGGLVPAAGKYFTLRRKPKSAALRAEILQKSTEAASHLKRSSGTTVPVKIRSFAKEMDDTTPLRGIPSDRTLTSSGFMRSTSISGKFGTGSSMTQKSGILHKEGGIKLLDIADQPLGLKEAKKRKRHTEQESSEKKKKDAQVVTTASVMPEYACGLLVNSLDELTDSGTSTVSMTSGTYLLPESLALASVCNAGSIPHLAGKPAPVTVVCSTIRTSVPPFVPVTQPVSVSLTSQSQSNIRFQLHVQGGLTILRPTVTQLQPSTLLSHSATTLALGGHVSSEAVFSNASPAARSSVRLLFNQPTSSALHPLGLTALQSIGSLQLQQHQLVAQQQNQLLTQQLGNQYRISGSVPHAIVTSSSIHGAIRLPTASIASPLIISTNNADSASKLVHSASDDQQQRKQSLQLTKEQMIEAQEMFRTSNKVTRPEKALILGFMAGSRENPVPTQGDIVNIRLSEVAESVQQVDGTFRPMTVETYFQMNYSTGEWKRVRKVRECEPDAD